jgi:serine/threonine protein phosphatase PrpC
MLRIASAAASHPGLRRDQNEDAYCIRPDLGLYLVADGMGGHAAGEVASRLAVDTIESFIERTQHVNDIDEWPAYDPAQGIDGNRLRMAFNLANRRLSEAATGDAALRGMATTASAALAGDRTIVIAHVGDSRIYRWRNRALEQLTLDHSWVGDRVRAGILTESDARQHPWRNVVTRALAGGEDPQVDIATLDVQDGDRLLLCSDGLSGVVPQARVEQLLGDESPLESTCQALVDAANAAGGPDNITVAILRADVA